MKGWRDLRTSTAASRLYQSDHREVASRLNYRDTVSGLRVCVDLFATACYTRYQMVRMVRGAGEFNLRDERGT